MGALTSRPTKMGHVSKPPLLTAPGPNTPRRGLKFCALASTLHLNQYKDCHKDRHEIQLNALNFNDLH